MSSPSSSFTKSVNAIVAQYMSEEGWTKYSENRLTREGARLYVQQHGLFTRHSRRAWAYVVGQCPVTEVRRFIEKENLWEEEGIEELSHYLKLVAMGKALGLTHDDVEDAEALPSTRAAFLIWETLTKDRHWLIGCTAKACLEQSNQPECGQFSYKQGHMWMSKLGLSREAVDFWLLHDELDQEHGGGAFELIEKYLPLVRHEGVTEEILLRTVEDSMFAFKTFYDGVARAAVSGERMAA